LNFDGVSALTVEVSQRKVLLYLLEQRHNLPTTAAEKCYMPHRGGRALKQRPRGTGALIPGDGGTGRATTLKEPHDTARMAGSARCGENFRNNTICNIPFMETFYFPDRTE